MGTMNGEDIGELIRKKYPPKEEVPEPSVIEKAKGFIESFKNNPKSRPKFMEHNQKRMEKGLPPLTYPEFADLTGESE